MKKLILLAALVLAGCGRELPPPEPIVRIVEVKTPVPVPCKALEELGTEPDYADTSEAIAAAQDIFGRVKLLLTGRAQRDARLQQYRAAKGSC